MPHKRILYLDVYRGIMLLWVLIDHISLNYGVIRYGIPQDGVTIFSIMSFFMCSFYFCSGYLLSTKRNFADYITHKFQNLIIPYVVYTILGIIIYTIYQYLNEGNISFEYFKNIYHNWGLKSNTPLWFFVSLFLCNTIIYYPIKLHTQGKLKNWIIITLILFCTFCARLLCNRTQYLGLGNVSLGLIYMSIGYLLKIYESKIDLKKMFYLCTILFLTTAVLFPSSLSFVNDLLYKGNFYINCIFSMSACYICWYICKLIPKENIIINTFAFLGANSMVLFASHRPFLNFIYEPIIRFIYPDISYSVFLLLNLILLILTSIIITWIGKKYLHFLIV